MSKMMVKITISVLLCIILVGCQEKTLQEKREILLLQIAERYIEYKKEHIAKIDSWMDDGTCYNRTYVTIYQREEDFNGYLSFWMTIANEDIRNDYLYYEDYYYKPVLPTKILKMKDRYIVLYMTDHTTIPFEDLPEGVFNNCEGYVMDETCWHILMCKNSLKHITVIDDIMIPMDCIKQFREFTCDSAFERDVKKVKLRIEDPILDWECVRRPPPPPPVGENF